MDQSTQEILDNLAQRTAAEQKFNREVKIFCIGLVVGIILHWVLFDLRPTSTDWADTHLQEQSSLED